MTSAVTSTGASATGASSVSSTSASSASATENQFLSILTTELTNQDPTNAMDPTTFASQLVSYAGLEQQITTNSKLDGITTLLTSLLASQDSGSSAAASGATSS
ncbi:flagellar hook capping FlgD N-terminal domain-containing protein [Caulobacter sp. KR2-114]|uniref:flagellar hook capping FlgD N-terminal domain-containing protein n=1 Tax=Caulobacter sp. KR2-114 TaxID=3400912 RepID=UPI003BFFBAB5